MLVYAWTHAWTRAHACYSPPAAHTPYHCSLSNSHGPFSSSMTCFHHWMGHVTMDEMGGNCTRFACMLAGTLLPKVHSKQSGGRTHAYPTAESCPTGTSVQPCYPAIDRLHILNIAITIPALSGTLGLGWLLQAYSPLTRLQSFFMSNVAA